MEAVVPDEGPRERVAMNTSPKRQFDRKVMSEETKDLRWLPIEEVGIHYNTLTIDGHRGYQRGLNPRKIADMVDRFDPREITAIVVSQRSDGTYWVLDGQHRLETLKLMGKSVILADVRHNMSIPQEAVLFYRLNAGTTRVGAWDQFQARIVGGDPVAVAIDKMITEHGYRLDRSGNTVKGIAAVASLEKVFRRGYLEEVLGIISTVWRTDKHAVDGPVVEGLGVFIHSYKDQPAYDRERLLDVLAITPPAEIYQRQRQLIVEMGRGSGQPAVLIAMAIRDVFNGKRRTSRKLTGPPISGTGKSLGYAARGGPRSQVAKTGG
jgi:hypothetical protein